MCQHPKPSLEEATKNVAPADPAEVEAFIAQYPALDTSIIEKFRSMDGRLQRTVMSKSLADARDVTAVLVKRVANALHMKPGDWVCPGCYDVQFARKAMCSQCGTPKPV